MLYLVILIALALLGLWVKEMIKSRELQLRLHIAQSAAEKQVLRVFRAAIPGRTQTTTLFGNWHRPLNRCGR